MSTDERDSEVLALQIGRPLRATSAVLSRCDLGLPIVAEVPPILDTGEPFPTRYWLTCPLAHRRIARIEARGGVRAAQERIAADPELSNAVEAARARYARERDALLPDGIRHRPSGGVGGSSGGVKCLHAHYADFAAGNDNPIGQYVHAMIGVPHCELPCVAVIDGKLQRNPHWQEPADDDDPR
jgi:hypothetical protein